MTTEFRRAYGRHVAARPSSVLIVDSHAVVGQGLGALLARQPDIDLVRQVRTAGEAIAYIGQHKPHVAIIDQQLEDGSGFQAAQQITSRSAGTRCVLTSSEATPALVTAAFKTGCRSFVPKQADAEVLLTAIRAVARGETYVPSELRQLLAEASRPRPSSMTLSHRQRQVLELVALGASIEEIKDQLCLSSHTVRNHLRHAMARLNANTRLAAVINAARAGLITLHPHAPHRHERPTPTRHRLDGERDWRQ
jgi:two-component system NarL family response regulator